MRKNFLVTCIIRMNVIYNIVTLILVLFYFIGWSQKAPFFDYDWKMAIDTSWGEGLPTEEKLALFDSVWTLIDEKYACFHHLDIDWDSLRLNYRPEIERGVSRGRFAAIMNHLSLKLKESHTHFFDTFVNNNYNPKPKTPLIYTGGWGTDTHFAAGLSPMPDSSLLVYVAASDHPLGLEPGDIILGYEGIPWKKWYKILLEMEFPIGFPSLWGANDKSFGHNWLSGAGRNWHLFETIDIIKYGSGDTLHLSTKLLENKEISVTYSEQLPVLGIPFNDELPQENEWSMSWGIVNNTKIGYIYIWSWFRNDPSENFFNALDSLINVYNVEGLIFDMRANSGGYISNSNWGLKLLFADKPANLGLARRSDPQNHFSLDPAMNYILYTDSTDYYVKPIAVLTGPLAISAADFVCYRLSEHPRVKFFGKTTSTSFSAPELLLDLADGWLIRYAIYNGFSENDPLRYLTHLEFQIDYELCFLPDDVHQGIDTIVKEAINWIQYETTGFVEKSPENINTNILRQNFPNPFNPTTTIKFTLSNGSHVKLKIFNILGEEVATLVSGRLTAGIYSYDWDASGFASGVYLYRLEAGEYVETRKMVLMR